MMIEITPRLALPLLHAAQAQKEFTHNEALIRLDALVGGVLAGGPTATPPADAAEGSLWLVGEAPTGAWAGQAHRLAIASANGWRFAAPPVGFTLSDEDGRPVRRTPTGWIKGLGVFDRLAVGPSTTVDDPTSGEVVDAQARASLAALLKLMRAQGLVGPTA